MAETTDGIDVMRQRMARASRTPPAPRNRGALAAAPGAASPRAADAPSTPVVMPEEAVSVPTAGEGRGKDPARARRRRTPAEPMRLAPDDPPVNLAIRVRRPLDDQLADIIHSLRGRGVRTSKVELIEMLLWELSTQSSDADRVLERLGEFRSWAPRGSGAPIGRSG